MKKIALFLVLIIVLLSGYIYLKKDNIKNPDKIDKVIEIVQSVKVIPANEPAQKEKATMNVNKIVVKTYKKSNKVEYTKVITGNLTVEHKEYYVEIEPEVVVISYEDKIVPSVGLAFMVDRDMEIHPTVTIGLNTIKFIPLNDRLDIGIGREITLGYNLKQIWDNANIRISLGRDIMIGVNIKL